MDAITDFRIVVCYVADGVVNVPDDHLHLVANENDFKSLCDRDVKRLASISLKNWRHPSLTKIGWCGRCNRRLKKFEDEMLKDVKLPRDRRRSAKWKWTPKLVEEARKLFAIGNSCREVSLMMQIPYTTMHRLHGKIKAGVPTSELYVRKKPPPREWQLRPELVEAVLRLLGEGKRQRDVARECQTSTATIQKILRSRREIV